MPAAATIDLKALRKAIASAIKGMRPGQPAPRVSATPEQIKHVVDLTRRAFLKEYQAAELRTVAKHFGEGMSAEDGCLKATDGPFTKVAEGVYGSAWLTKDKTRIFKIGKVYLVDDVGHSVTESFDNARREFAIGRKAADLGVGPKVHDSYFCCSTDDACYFVIVMDNVAGVTLKKWLKSASKSERENMRGAILDKVAVLNEAGIEHADLHSKNVLVTSDGNPYIIDYGLASWASYERKWDVDMVNRTFSDTVNLDDVAYYVATVLIFRGDVKI